MQQEFQIDASRRQCNLCQRRFQPLDQYVSVLREVEAELIDQPAGQGEAAAATAAADDGQMAGSAEAQAAADDQKADDNKSEGEAVAPAAAAERPVAAKSPEAGSGLGLVREDYCPGCAPEQRGGTVAVWHSRVAPPEIGRASCRVRV